MTDVDVQFASSLSICIFLIKQPPPENANDNVHELYHSKSALLASYSALVGGIVQNNSGQFSIMYKLHTVLEVSGCDLVEFSSHHSHTGPHKYTLFFDKSIT